MLTLVLAESALQIVPLEIQSHPQIKQYAKRRRKAVNQILLDRSFHHQAMKHLARSDRKLAIEKMGRPDIIHGVLLQVLDTPLNWEGQLRTFIHTQDDHVITVNSKIRVPRNYLRFVGLIEQLFVEGRVPEQGDALLSLEQMPLAKLVARSRPSSVLAFSTLGEPKLLRDVAVQASGLDDPMVLVGGFPRGHFTDGTRKLVDKMFKIDHRSLDAWVVAGRFVYDFEWSIGLAKARLTQKGTSEAR